MLRPSTLAVLLAAAAMLLAAGGLAAGSDGWSLAALQGDAMQWALVRDIRAPRTLGAMLVGALLGVAGALAQGLFRNPLADPYLLGSAAGAGLGVVAVLAAGAASGHLVGWTAVQGLLRLGMVGAAFAGALAGVLLTLLLARGAGRPLVLLLAGIVVGILLGAAAELLALASPEALRGRQVFLLGTTSFLGWPGVAVLCGAALLVLPLAWRLARVLDALVLGEAGAASLGLPLAPLRLLLVVLMALATGAAVAQAGLVAFVGLVAPHLVRRLVTVAHGALLLLSALAGAVLLGAADLAARTLLAPQELPVGLLTAVVGGVYLLALLRRRAVS
ncbi:MAG: FecCD family ABC transporter permease [Pseudomonadota bacterium]|jgi:iron complex transport system permease protein|nr:iron ABC transporter permease [Rubrivivax sp.]MCA3257224.1 iron ABC transporter permease [Rubrivivax sp.]